MIAGRKLLEQAIKRTKAHLTDMELGRGRLKLKEDELEGYIADEAQRLTILQSLLWMVPVE